METGYVVIGDYQAYEGYSYSCVRSMYLNFMS